MEFKIMPNKRGYVLHIRHLEIGDKGYRPMSRNGDESMCKDISPGGWICTREKEHSGRHVAHTGFGRYDNNLQIASWNSR